MKKSINKNIWFKIFKNFKPLWKFVVLAFISSSLLALVDVLYPLLNLYAINKIIELDDRSNIVAYIMLFGVFVILQLILTFFFIKCAGKIQVELAADLRRQAFQKLQQLSFSYFDRTPIGWIMSRLTSDAKNLSDILSFSIIDLLWGILVMIGIIIVMFMVNIKLAIIALAVLPILIVVSIFFRKKILDAFRNIRKINGKITGAINEGITGAITTKTLVLEKENYNEFEEITQDMKSQSVRVGIYSGLYGPTTMFISGLGTVFILYFGGYMVADNVILVGTLFLFISYLSKFFRPVMELANIIAKFQQAQASAERVIGLIESEPDIVDSDEVIKKYGDSFNPKKENWEDIDGKVVFENVSFKYDDGNEVIKNFSLEVESGHSVAIVGHTGSGKSTIVNILCRFYEPVTGRVLIDDKDYKDRSISWLHNQLGYVLQSPQLFSGTILENIKFAKQDATLEEVISVAKYVELDSFIQDMENGYDTEVGEGGSRLSVGQKQLISFARAILADPKILILDEATSSVDTETEKIIQHAIDKVLKNRTSFVIAHRLSTITSCNRILVLKDGEVIEDGTHAELIGNRGHYYKLFTNQFKSEKLGESIL